MAKRQNYLKRKQTFSGTQVILFVLAFAAVGAVAIWQSLAAPHSKSSSSITGPIVVSDVNGNSLPNKGDTVDFIISTTATKYPMVGLRCYQGSDFVYDGYKSFYGTDPTFTSPFKLDSGYWKDGADAKCTARLFYNDKRGRQVVLSTLDFQVYP